MLYNPYGSNISYDLVSNILTISPIGTSIDKTPAIIAPIEVPE
jgi:hypothetical protein